MSFYDSTPLGRILSRVSADLSIVDLDAPFSFISSVGATTNAYSNLTVLAVVTWQVLFVSIPMIYLEIRLQRYYFASAKELMRINGTTKPSVANHLAESIAGSMAIRTFEEEDRFFIKNLHLIDINASPFFHSFAANEWLIQRLETLSTAVLSSSALCVVLLPPGTFCSRFIGMALSYGLSLNMQNREWEDYSDRCIIPSSGACRGKIVVDGIDISTLGLHDLRSCFGIIPQDPTLFNGTVRYNLDPLSQHSDQEIWEVLGKCQLREVVQDKEVGLDSLVVEDGSNWSMGQR
ncbi:hypothetical protein U1Q18_004544 [Sarracenia purpurea var. burkii]